MHWKQALLKMVLNTLNGTVKKVILEQERQKDRDVYRATCAFVELKQSDRVIYGLLNMLFGIGDISVACEYVNNFHIEAE